MIRMMSYYMTINLSQGHGNNCELDHLHDVDMSKGVDMDSDYNNDNDEKNYEYCDGHIDLEGPLCSFKENFR